MMSELRGTRIHILIEPDGNGRQRGSHEWQRAVYDYDVLAPSDRDRITWKELFGAILIGAIAGATLCLLA